MKKEELEKKLKESEMKYEKLLIAHFEFIMKYNKLREGILRL